MSMSIEVLARIQGLSINCEILHAFKNKETLKSYIIIRNPLESEVTILIPLLFNPDVDFQDAILLTDEQDISVIEGVINKNACQIQYLPNEGMTIVVRTKHSPDSDFAENLRRFAESNELGRLQPRDKDIGETIRRIDARIVHLAAEEFFSTIEQQDDIEHKFVPGLILSILEQNVLLTHIPLNTIDTLISQKQIAIPMKEMFLLKAFQGIIVAFGKKEVIRQDIESALVTLAECEKCTKQIFDAVINHETFSEVFSGDVLQSVRSNIVLRVPTFFNTVEIKAAANYYYAKREYNNALKGFNRLYEIISADDSNDKEKVDTLNSIGCCYVSIMKFDEAYSAFRQATNLDNKYAAAYNNWAYTIIVECDTLHKGSIRQGKLQEALVYINDAIQLNTSDVSFISNRAFIEYELGQYEHVIRDFTRAQEISTKYSDISTILKLALDSKIRQYIKSPQKHNISFSDLYDDLCLVFNNEESGNKLYFEALDVYNKINSHETRENISFVTLELVLLEVYIKELMASISVKNPFQGIYYYTSMENLQKLLCDESTSVEYRLPIFSANHMNDPSEGQELEKAFFQYVGDEPMVQDLFYRSADSSNTKRKQLEAEFTFLKAFTMNDDSLPMWVHYASSGNGCCVKVNAHFFTNFDNDISDNEKTLKTNPFDNEYRLYEVIYLRNGKIANDVPADVNDLFDNIFTRASTICSKYNSFNQDTRKVVISAMSKMVNKLKYLFKSVDYIYEQEMRIVLKRSLGDFKRNDIDVQMSSATATCPIPKVFLYTDKGLLIDEIILGPKINETDNIIPFLAMKLLRLNGYDVDKVHITKSAIEYR